MSDNVLDIFGGDFFGMANLTAALIKRPTVPGLTGALNLFADMPLNTDKVIIEELNQQVGLLPYTNPNGPGTPVTADKRTGRPFQVPTIRASAEVWASDVMGVRAFGSSDMLQTVESKVGEVTDKVRQGYFSPTEEFLRVQSIRGYIGNPGTPGTPILDLCTEMGVSRATALDMDLTSSTAATVIGYCDTIRERIINGIGGVPFTGVMALCGRAFYRALKVNPIVRADIVTVNTGLGMNAPLLTNLGPNNTEQMLNGTPAILWQGILWVEYSMSLGLGLGGAVEFIPSAEAVAFPTGVPAMFIRHNAPAPYLETANTMGLPIYAKSELKRFGKGVDIELTARPLFLNSRPGSVIRLY